MSSAQLVELAILTPFIAMFAAMAWWIRKLNRQMGNHDIIVTPILNEETDWPAESGTIPQKD